MFAEPEYIALIAPLIVYQCPCGGRVTAFYETQLNSFMKPTDHSYLLKTLAHVDVACKTAGKLLVNINPTETTA